MIQYSVLIRPLFVEEADVLGLVEQPSKLQFPLLRILVLGLVMVAERKRYN